jgi:hypothetical protein
MYDKIKDIEYRLVVARFSNLLDDDIKNHVTHLYNVSSETSILPLKSGSISVAKVNRAVYLFHSCLFH